MNNFTNEKQGQEQFCLQYLPMVDNMYLRPNRQTRLLERLKKTMQLTNIYIYAHES